ncbi:MAG TPA: 6-carboxytetrahydropterin synthase [Terriglobia bacterium]|nr:6-carboxytetrahydropterin synthase [Terriglobia bacterium]
MVYLTRRYRISAAHRLHNDALSADENARLYGKCNNPRGHGHDYGLEVTVAGEVDPRTGMVMDLGVLDALVEREVMSRLDHKHLNLDVENFRNRVPTTENLCIEIYNLLARDFPVWPAAPDGESGSGARLKRVRVEETRSNFFEYEGEVAAGKRS